MHLSLYLLPHLKVPIPQHKLYFSAKLGIFQISKCTKLSHTSGSLHMQLLAYNLGNCSEDNLSLTSETRLDSLNMCSRKITLNCKCILNCLFSPIGYKVGAFVYCCIFNALQIAEQVLKYLLNE